ncbi:MAG TPA: hypothetical protein VMG59_13415 [Phycisphaerae bacterium]|nr:hypothetical protein [Phycisphaerae bacterium]
MQIPTNANQTQSNRRKFVILACVIATILMFSFFSQLPTIADWSLFAFWAPGSILKGDLLISMGMRPAVDFGYTYGLAVLEIARWGFALLGRTPSAFLIMTAVMEILMAFALARLAVALRLSWQAIIFLLAALPVAVIPNYGTLTHPLEALLLSWALGRQAVGARSQALAICTACAFVKPSMAYIYGFILLLWTIRELLHSKERILIKLLSQTWLAILTALFMATALAWRFGIHSLLLTIFPVTGMHTYHDFSFGLISIGLLQFVFPDYHPWFYYLVTPAGIWIIVSLLTAAGMIRIISLLCLQLFQRQHKSTTSIYLPGILPHLDPRGETILSIGAMQLIFIFGFYGGMNAWQYYSYLPVLFTAVLISNLSSRRFSQKQLLEVDQPSVLSADVGKSEAAKIQSSRSFRVALALSFLALISQTVNIQIAWTGWTTKVRTPETGYLWADKDQFMQWNDILAKTSPEPTLMFTFGYLPWMPQGMSMPLGWYPNDGIRTPLEITRLKSEILCSQYVVILNTFHPHDPWESSDFASIHRKFSLVFMTPTFSLWRQ